MRTNNRPPTITCNVQRTLLTLTKLIETHSPDAGEVRIAIKYTLLIRGGVGEKRPAAATSSKTTTATGRRVWGRRS